MFKKYNLLPKSPLRIYADFVSILENIYEEKEGKTVRYQKHFPVSFFIKFVSEVKEL